MRTAAFAFVMLAAGLAGAVEQRPVWNGSWIATAGPQVFRGTWSARTLPNNLDAAVGSWTMNNEAGDVVMQGTWSGRKTKHAWRGTWEAKAQTGGGASGTWQAAIPADFKGKTFEDMLQAAAAAREMSGNWHMGRTGGNWWLRALPAP